MPTSPSYGHATPRARALPEPLDLAPHTALPEAKEKRLRVLQMLCCLTSDRLWLCGCAGAEPGGGVRGALDEPGRGERLLRTRRHARRADRLLVRRDREPGAPTKSASRLSTPRVWLISYGLCSCFIRGGTIWTRWSRATRASSIGATCRTPSLDEDLEDMRRLRNARAKKRATKQHGGEWAQDTRPAAAQCVPSTKRFPPAATLSSSYAMGNSSGRREPRKATPCPAGTPLQAEHAI